MSENFPLSSYEDYLTAADVFHEERVRQELAASSPCGYCDNCGVEHDSSSNFCTECEETL